MEVDWTLTWYRGSVLPYHSLWFTLMRVAALNQMKVSALNDLVHEPGDLPSILHDKSVRTHHLSDEVDTRRLALFLGESHDAFHWSHTGALSQWRQGLFLPNPRVCLQCAHEGYHSALFSLKLLRSCPIHGCELLSECLCGEKFPDRLTNLDCARGGTCGCGKLEFLTRQTCRQPTVGPVFARPLDPIANWLDEISSVIRIPDKEQLASLDDLPAWILWIRQWCDLYDIAFPSCFTVANGEERPAVVKTIGGHMSGGKSNGFEQLRKSAIVLEFGGHLKVHDATYSSYSRYLRQHVAVDSERWIRRFQKSGDPLEIAAWMRGSAKAYFAFAYMLWVHTTDESRVWDFPRLRPLKHASRCRKVEEERAESIVRKVNGDDVVDSDSKAEPAQVAWVRGHRAIASLEQVWDAAIERASQSVESGNASWGPLRLNSKEPEIVVRLAEDGAIHLLELREQRAMTMFGTIRRDGKVLRIAAEEQRRAEFLSRLEGEALDGYLALDGEKWVDVEPLIPDGRFVRRWSLVDSGFHPHSFWLFSCGDMFVARSRIVPLQLSRKTPKQAINALRESTIAHIVKSKIRLPRYVSPEGRRSALTMVKASSEAAELVYRVDVAKVVGEAGFWRAGALAQFHARRLQETLQTSRNLSRKGDDQAT